MTVTRIEIADLLTDAFGPDGASKAELLAVADEKDAPQRVKEQLQTLPPRTFRRMRDLWVYLNDIPVG